MRCSAPVNLQLTQVLSDVTGLTGLKIIRAIVAGERDPLKLAALREVACKSSQDEIAKALTGTWKAEHVFILKQSLELFDFYTQQIAACDAEVERQYAAIKPRWDAPEVLPQLPRAQRDSHSKNEPAFNARQAVFRVSGVDIAGVDGLSGSLAQTILAEISTDMSAWPTVKHFTSWLGLAPHNAISGGEVLRSRALKTRNTCGAVLPSRPASVSLGSGSGGAQRLCFRGLLPAQAGAVWTQVGERRDGAQDRTLRVLHVEASCPVSSSEGGSV